MQHKQKQVENVSLKLCLGSSHSLFFYGEVILIG